MLVNYIPIAILAALVAAFFYAKYSYKPTPASPRITAEGVPGTISAEASQSRTTNNSPRTANVIVSGSSSKSETAQLVIIGKSAASSAKRPPAFTEEEIIAVE